MINKYDTKGLYGVKYLISYRKRFKAWYSAEDEKLITNDLIHHQFMEFSSIKTSFKMTYDKDDSETIEKLR